MAVSMAAALLLGCVLSGCAAAGHEGTWKATDVESPAKIHMDPSLTGSSLSFELESGGKGNMTLNGASVDITWSETSSGVELDQEGGHTLDLTDSDGKLTMKDANGNTIYFEKQ
jgi:hypothetical protein